MDFRPEAYKYEPPGWRASKCPSSAPVGHSSGPVGDGREAPARPLRGRVWCCADRRDDHGPARVPDVPEPDREPVRARVDEGHGSLPHVRRVRPVRHVQGLRGPPDARRPDGPERGRPLHPDHHVQPRDPRGGRRPDLLVPHGREPVLPPRLLPVHHPAHLHHTRGENTKLNETSAGRIALDVLNRYYIPQSVVYENGAVIRSQSDGQAVRADPTFEVGVVNNSVQVSWTHVSLFGQGSASGTTTEGIHSKLLGVDRQDYANVRSDLWINATTVSGVAWVAYFNRTLGIAFGVERSEFTLPGYSFSTAYLSGQSQSLSITTPYYKLTADYKTSKLAYDIVIRIYNDWNNTKPLVSPITVVRIQHAFVNIAIAEKGAEVEI